MIINRENLNAVRTGFSTAYGKGVGRAPSQYTLIATTVPSSVREQTYGWLGQLPSVREWVGARVVQNLSDVSYSIKEKAFELTIGVSRDDIETDNLGTYGFRFEAMGESTGATWDQLCFGLLKDGFTTACYDGQNFFDTDHPVRDGDGNVTSVANTDGGNGPAWFLLDVSRVVKPVILQKRKDFSFVAKDKETDDNVFDNNEFVYGADARANVGFGFWQFAWGSRQELGTDTYELARSSLMGMKGDGGRPIGVVPSLLVVPPALEGAARRLVENEFLANGESNPWKGTAKVEVVPWLA